MTRLNAFAGPPVRSSREGVSHIKDLVTDVSWNYRVKERIAKFKPRRPDAPDGTWRMAKKMPIACRSFESVSSVFCAKTSPRASDHQCTNNSSARVSSLRGRLEMHPLDEGDRIRDLKN